MDYDTIASAYLAPPNDHIATPAATATPARRLRDALEPIATQGWWSRPAADRITALGLGFFDGYVWGRAAALGEPAASVVVSAFGVFEPTFLTAVYNQGRAVATRSDVLAAREDGAAESLSTVLGGAVRAEAGELADVLLTALDEQDSCARPLFSGLRELATPTDEFARLWRASELVREHRGDGHLAACISAGLNAAEMNVLTELWLGYGVGEYSSSRGFGTDACAAGLASLVEREWVLDHTLSEAGVAARTAIEYATDRSQDGLVSSLQVGLADVTSGLDGLIARVDVLSTVLMEARVFPSDPRKRAAG